MPIEDTYPYQSDADAKPFIDLRNVPCDSVAVSITVEDERLKTVIQSTLTDLQATRLAAIENERWNLVADAESKIAVLGDVLTKAAI